MPHGQIVIEMGGLNWSFQPGMTSDADQWPASFENRTLPAIMLADLNPVEWQ